jgi:hypothetical protein
LDGGENKVLGKKQKETERRNKLKENLNVQNIKITLTKSNQIYSQIKADKKKKIKKKKKCGRLLKNMKTTHIYIYIYIYHSCAEYGAPKEP